MMNLFEALSGRCEGYYLGDTCRYHMEVGNSFVQVNYQPNADDSQVHGSSTKNSDGNYIAWYESLTQT